VLALAALVVVAPAAGATAARTRSSRPVATSSSHTVWLCRPGLAHNPCTTSRDAALVAANGSRHVEHAPAAKSQPIDCFYVYPTVSPQPTVNANLHVDPAETGVAVAQASRFSQVCRVYAPMYRQLTLQAIGGGATPAAAALAYGDVRDAWRDYLAHDNHGRGVVLIGHSQGAGMLIQLIKREIDPKPKTRRLLTSAVLLGGNLIVPHGRDVGGDFAHIPACRSTSQTGCVVAYSTFDHPPPANALFGRAATGYSRVRGATTVKDPQVLCVNPAALRGGSAIVHPYFPIHVNLGVLTSGVPRAITANIPQPWVGEPGLFSAECRDEGGASWLQVTDQRAPGDVRPPLTDTLGPTWGLHLVDVNIELGDLVGLVGHQAAAWARHH
jgi:hypothetical protein